MKYQIFLLLLALPLTLLTEPINISGEESPIKLSKEGTYTYQVDFASMETHSTYYIATKESKAKVSLFLGGNCLEHCSNLVEFPNEENNCGTVEDFAGKYHLIKLYPNEECNLYFTIKTSEQMEILVHHQATIQVNEIQTIPLIFPIASAPIFLEYTPKFPATFMSQAKIYVNPVKPDDISEVYFGKDADHQDCNTHFPDKDKHCFTFKLPSYEEPNSYFIAFSYVTIYTSNLYIGIYPGNEKVKEAKVTIGYSMPFLEKGVQCPEQYYLSKFNEDTFCSQCSLHCDQCVDEGKCQKCEQGYAIFEGKCQESECESFELYKNSEGKCVECKENCKYCDQQNCLECKEQFILVEGNCEAKQDCKQGEYYNTMENKCEECMVGCKSCVEKEECEECEEGFVYQKVQSQCIPALICKSNQYLDESTNECFNCKEKCEKCSNAEECIQCEKGFIVQDGICVKDCGPGKYYNEENQKCEYCIKNCKKCSDKATCENCKNGYYLTEEKLCKESPLCKPGYYLTPERNNCNKCPKDCTSCKNETFCQNCRSEYALVGHQICAPSCAKYKFYSITEQKCSACIQHCENCLDEQTCEKCRKGFKYHVGEGKCISTLDTKQQSAQNLIIGIVFLLFLVLLF